MTDKEHGRRELVLWVAIAVLSVLLVIVASLGAWGLQVWGTNVDYSRFGNWSEAISGVATLAAVAVAAAAIFFEHRSAKNSEAQRLKDSETSLFLWLASLKVEQPDRITYVWHAEIENRTNAPIFPWILRLDGYEHEHICSYSKRPILPVTGANQFNLTFLDGVEPARMPGASLVFQGSSGRVWQRTVKGAVASVSSAALVCEHAALLDQG